MLVLCLGVSHIHAADKLKVLVLHGQNNHSSFASTPVMKWILESTGRFEVHESITPPEGPKKPTLKKDAAPEEIVKHEARLAKYLEDKEEYAKNIARLWDEWRPSFKGIDAILCNYNGERWPERVDRDFLDYMKNGGGLVVVHAADNSFGDWEEYNKMIAVGGWGGRTYKSGPMIRWREGKIWLDRESKVPGGGHGPAEPYMVNIINHGHPITAGLPEAWLHSRDELYCNMRGPCENVTVLANALSCKSKELEPVLMVINYEKGRVFHTVLGHGVNDSMYGIGFQVTLARGTEWAATGNVTLPAPPQEDMSSVEVKLRQMHPKK